jgi:predicted DNA binding CopG/RHH family protein
MEMQYEQQKLDEEEQELFDSLEKGEWQTVANLEEEKQIAKQAAKNYLRKNKEKRISIRIFAKDLERLRELAEEEGLPYQTLITSILHKFTIGKLATR